MRRSILIALGGISALAMAAPASAALIYDPVAGTVTTSGSGGGSVDIFFEGVGNDDLGAQLTLTFVGIDGNGDFDFTYALTNTSGDSVTSSRLSVWGFDSDPDPVLADSTISGADFVVDTSGNFPGGQDLEICFKEAGSQTSNCNNGNDGVAQGGSTSGSFNLGVVGSPTSIVLSDFRVRFQSVCPPANGEECEGSDTGNPVPGVPEPGTWGMMLLGFAGAGYALRRRRRNGKLLQLA